ncbi:aspartate aminotransferase family protein, partial [candidate division KSB1 bacterium]|nr:aspartate aminotransferase family protein [candidate division KSB1 bacterium]
TLAGKIAKACQERGLRTRPVGNTLAFAPPLIIAQEEIDTMVNILGNALDAMKNV